MKRSYLINVSAGVFSTFTLSFLAKWLLEGFLPWRWVPDSLFQENNHWIITK